MNRRAARWFAAWAATAAASAIGGFVLARIRAKPRSEHAPTVPELPDPAGDDPPDPKP